MANYTSDYSFKIDGISSDEYGVFVDTLEPVPHANQRYTEGYTGSDEPFSIPDSAFEKIQYTIRFYKFFPDGYNDKELRKFLTNGSVLELSTYPDVYFKILTIRKSDPRQMADGKRFEYNVTFGLKPFRYGIENPWIELSSGDTVENIGTWKSKLTLELTEPDGDIKITVNNTEYEIKGLTASGDSVNPNKVYIDTSRFIVYDGNNNLITGKDSGKMPELLVGNNVISWTGTVDTVRIKTNWREI